MELHGIIKSIGMVERITETFSKVEVDIDTSTFAQGSGKKYENYARVQFVNERINLLAGFTTGERVKIGFKVSGNYYTNAEGKTFFAQNLNGTKIERL